MELNRKLVMTFKTTDDKKVSLTVDNPREDLTEEEVEESLYEMAEGYDIVDREIFISDAMELFPDAFSKETLNMIFDNTHFREYDLDDDEDLQGYYNYD